MQFAYTAKSTNGQTSQGTLVADSLQNARQLLRQQGLFATSVATLGARSAQCGPAGQQARRKHVPRKDIMAMTSQWAIMIKAGIDVAGSLESLARQCDNPNLLRHAGKRASGRDGWEIGFSRLEGTSPDLRPLLCSERCSR